MKNRTNTKLTLAVSVFLLAASQTNLVQAAEDPYSSQAVPPGYNPGYQYYPPQQYTQGYPRPNYRDRNYNRNSSFSPRGGSGPGFSGPWDSGRGSSMPWDSNRGGRSMPWDSGRGGRSMPWDSGRGGWMNKDRFADGWDDMLNKPSDMGEMPGGFTAPSVSAPNPVDVGDEFNNAARDAPEQMRNVYDDNRRSNTR